MPCSAAFALSTPLAPACARGLRARGVARRPPRRPRTARLRACAAAEGGGEGEAVRGSDAKDQVDDGSLSEMGSFVAPVRIERRKPKPKEVLDALKPGRRGVLGFLGRGFESHKGVVDGVVLGGMFLTWYWANTAFNVYNKQVLEVFPFPVTCTTVQFLVAALCMISLWVVRVKELPRFNVWLVRATAPLAVLHAAGFLLTNMSLGKVSVAFTHTVKSTEPFFSVALTPSILGEVPTWGILMSLCPIVAGVALASATDVSFNWIGFLSAVGSNLALQGRNVLSKKLMSTTAGAGTGVGSGRGRPPTTAVATSPAQEISTQSILPLPAPGRGGGGMAGSAGEEAVGSDGGDAGVLCLKETEEEILEDTLAKLDNVNLFSTMTIFAFLLLLPVSLLWEGVPFLTAAAAQSVTGMSSWMLGRKLVLGGVCRCLDVLASYMILKRVSPVTHSVGNCVKRAVVIAMSIVIFKTQMSFLNVVGTLLALAGVFVYSMIVSACKQNSFGPENPLCKPIYEMEVELTAGGGI